MELINDELHDLYPQALTVYKWGPCFPLSSPFLSIWTATSQIWHWYFIGPPNLIYKPPPLALSNLEALKTVPPFYQVVPNFRTQVGLIETI